MEPVIGRRLIATLATAVAGVLFLAPSARAQLETGTPWPKFHANLANTGISTGKLPAGVGVKKWSFATGDIILGSPAIGSDGTIYFGSYDDNVYAVNGSTGALKWSFYTGGNVESSPAIGSDGTVYIGSNNDSFYALDGATGAEKWVYQGNDIVSAIPTIGPDGTVYILIHNSLYALDPTNGTAKWSFLTQLTGGLSTCPAIGPDGTIYIASYYLYAVNPNTGAQIWQSSASDLNYSSPALSPDGKTIYSGSYDDNLYAIDAATGHTDWSFNTGDYIGSSPAVGSDGTIYIGSYNNYVYAVTPGGLQKWAYQTGRYAVPSPAIGSDGTVYAASFDNSVYALNGQTGVEKWSFATGAAIESSPAIGADGTIYVGSADDSFYAITTVPGLSSFYALPASVSGGTGTRAVLQVPSASSFGLSVALQSSSPDVQFSSTVTIPAGVKGVSFALTSSPVSTTETVTLTASLGSSILKTPITLNPYPIMHLYASPSTVTSGASTVGVVQLAGKAGPSGDLVTLQSNNPNITTSGLVTVPAGATGASFTIETLPVASSQTGYITAFSGSSEISTLVTINPNTVTGFYASPSTVVGGVTTHGVVQIAAPAGSGGLVVSLQSASGTAVVPAAITVPAGKTGVSFTIRTSAVTTSTSVTLTATYGSSSKQATLTLNP